MIIHDARLKYRNFFSLFQYSDPPGPVYLSEPLKVYTVCERLKLLGGRVDHTPSQQLQSFTNCVHFLLRKMYSECSFSYIVPALWYTLPKVIRLSPSVSSFRSALKTPFCMRESEREWERVREGEGGKEMSSLQMYAWLDMSVAIVYFALVVNVVSNCKALWPTVRKDAYKYKLLLLFKKEKKKKKKAVISVQFSD